MGSIVVLNNAHGLFLDRLYVIPTFEILKIKVYARMYDIGISISVTSYELRINITISLLFSDFLCNKCMLFIFRSDQVSNKLAFQK